MSRKNKNSKGKTLAVLSVALLLGAGVTTVGIGSGGFQNWDVQTWFNQNADEPGNIDANIDAHGMKVRKLATIENQDGSVSQIYSYSVTPSGATRKEMTISVAWNGETNASIADFITAEVDSQAQTFTITKKADFATQAKATIRAVSAQGVYADILIDCKQVFLGFNQNTTLNAVKNVDADHAIGLASIKEALAIQAGGNNVSSTYTIALTGGYTLGNLSFANPNYVMGNALDAIADAGITETNEFSIKAKDLSVDLGLSDIQGLVSGDYAKFGESKVQEIEGKAYFGLSFTMTGTLSRKASPPTSPPTSPRWPRPRSSPSAPRPAPSTPSRATSSSMTKRAPAPRAPIRRRSPTSTSLSALATPIRIPRSSKPSRCMNTATAAGSSPTSTTSSTVRPSASASTARTTPTNTPATSLPGATPTGAASSPTTPKAIPGRTPPRIWEVVSTT